MWELLLILCLLISGAWLLHHFLCSVPVGKASRSPCRSFASVWCQMALIILSPLLVGSALWHGIVGRPSDVLHMQLEASQHCEALPVGWAAAGLQTPKTQWVASEECYEEMCALEEYCSALEDSWLDTDILPQSTPRAPPTLHLTCAMRGGAAKKSASKTFKKLTKKAPMKSMAMRLFAPKRGKLRAALTKIKNTNTGKAMKKQPSYVPEGQNIDAATRALRRQKWAVNSFQLAALKDAGMPAFLTGQKMVREWVSKPCPWRKERRGGARRGEERRGKGRRGEERSGERGRQREPERGREGNFLVFFSMW